jgi:acyl-CoA thioester hydrolase
MQNIKSFEIRWNDLDPNRHVANTTYSALMNDRRMSFLSENGFTQEAFEKLQIGPAILSEQFYYLKEVLPGSTVFIDIELLSNTVEYTTFSHSLFIESGKMALYSTVMFTWIDLSTRKAIVPPDELINLFDRLKKSEEYRVMNENEIRAGKIPIRVMETS